MCTSKEFDVVALGELLIDFTSNGLSNQGNILFEANPGGAPCNVLTILNKLGKKTSFIGKVGKDQFGLLLNDTIKQVGINTDNLVLDEEVNTTLAFVHTAEDGDRSFSFYREKGADMMLREDEIREDIFKKSKIFHFGTLSMTNEGVRNATKKALKFAKENNLLISFDPNLRPPLWKSLDEAKEQIMYGLEYCDILKIADEELEFVTGLRDIDEGVKYLRNKYNIKLVLVTMGKNGSKAYYKEFFVEKKGFLQKNTVDTTGAGDTFCGSILNYILENDLKSLSQENLEEMLIFANAAASLITTKKGVIKSMPEKDEILKLIEN